MSKVRSSHGWLAAFAGAGALALAVAGGVAYAAFPDTDVDSYAGCVNDGGQISQVAVGDTPLKPCNENQQLVHLSGGDITKVTVGAGLTGGGDNGAVTVGLDTAHSLPQECADGEVPKSDGAGAWSCAEDDDTRYSAGPGLDQSGTQFSVRPGYQLPQTCSNGQVPARQGASWTCADTTESEVFADGFGFANVPQGSNPEVARLTLPGGVYLVSVTGTARDDSGGDGEIGVRCELWRNGTTFVVDARVDVGDEAEVAGPASPIAITTVVDASNQFANWTLNLHCSSSTGSDHLENLQLTALRVGSVRFQ